MLTLIFNIAIIAGIFAAIAALWNTQVIMKDLAAIKEKLNIKDDTKPSIFKDDLDKD